MKDKNGNNILNDTTIELIMLLRKNGKMTVEEIANDLKVSYATVRKHRNLAEKFGFKIESTAGNVNNGYELVEEKLTDKEITFLKKQLGENLSDKVLNLINRI